MPPMFTDELLCPTDEQIAAFVDHGLPELERRVIEAHLAICDPCRELVAAVHFLREDV